METISEKQCEKEQLYKENCLPVIVRKTKKNQFTSEKDIDGGWAWIIFIMAIVTRTLMGGMFWAINSYFVVFHEEFKENRSFTAAIGSVTFATFHVTAPVASMMIQRFGVRATTIVGSLLVSSNYLINSYADGVLYLIFTHGIFLGVGLSFVSNSSFVALSQNFKRYANFALGISLAGTGIGMFIFAQLIPHLLETYGWRGSMYLLAGISLQYCICGSVMFPVKNPQSSVEIKQNVFDCNQIKKMVSSGKFCFLNIAQFFYAISAVTITVLYKDIALVYGMGDIFEWSLTMFGAGDIVGRTITGLATSHPRIHSVVFNAGVNVFTAFVVLCHLAVTSSRAGFLILGFLLGSGVGAQISMYGIIVLTMFGRQQYIMALGYVQTTSGLGALIGPPIAGWLTDLTKAYTWALIFVAAVNLFSTLNLLIAYRLTRNEKEIVHMTENEIFLKSCPSKQINGDKFFINEKQENRC